MTTASLGGNFGLFLGASVLTVVQIFEYLFDELFASCSCSTSSNRVRDSGAKPATRQEESDAADDSISIINIDKGKEALR